MKLNHAKAIVQEQKYLEALETIAEAEAEAEAKAEAVDEAPVDEAPVEEAPVED